MVLSTILVCVLSIAALGYYFLKQRYNYWANRGIPYVEPKFLVGNMSGMSTKQTFGETLMICYDDLKGKGPLGGIYMFTEPVALIVDMDLLRNVFVKDFEYFRDRGMYVNERDDPLSAHLFSLEGPQWKNLRAKLSPTFTSGKMKMMHSTLLAVSNQLSGHLTDLSAGKVKELELKEILSQFTTDVIVNVAFGVECNSLKDPNCEFRRIGRKILETDSKNIIKEWCAQIFPKIARLLRMRILSPEITNFFLTMLGDTVKHREANNVQRNDFLSLLIQMMKTGKLEGETADLGKLTFNELAAQVFLFFLAGFETSSSTMTFAFYELALNLEIQEKAREEVREVMGRHGGQLTYEACMELRYIDQIIQETLRKYPVVEMLIRKTSQAYKVPETEMVLEKGTTVFIPVLGFHRDPDIFPDPEKFDPQRFTKIDIGSRHPYAWTPFGKGPRDCIGMRFGMMQTRLGIATMLNNFRVSPSKQTLIPMKFQCDSDLLSPAGGMFLNIETIKDNA